MTRTLIYGIIALIIVIVVAGVALFFSDPNRNSEQGADTQDSGGFFGSLFPFNQDGNGDTVPLFEGDTPGEREAGPVPDLREVSTSPVSGGYLFEQDEVTMIRFIDRATGNVYETEAESSAVKRVTNTTVPGIQEVLWANENEFIVRYLDGGTIETFFVSLDPDAEGEQPLNGSFVSSFDRGSIDAAGENVFAVFENESGSNLVISNPNGGSPRSVLSSSIRSWVPLQSNAGLFVQTAPAANAEGSLYTISNGALVKAARSFLGFTAQVSPNGKYAFIATAGQDTIGSLLVDLEENEEYASAIDTLPEKCVFVSSDGSELYCGASIFLESAVYPDDWFLGTTSFSDDIWHVKPLEGVAEFLATGDDVNETFDVWQPSVSPDGNYFLFINKNDLSLWSLRIPEGN